LFGSLAVAGLGHSPSGRRIVVRRAVGSGRCFVCGLADLLVDDPDLDEVAGLAAEDVDHHPRPGIGPSARRTALSTSAATTTASATPCG
jgi:hypothetical protein